jgi:hypothetical protein
LLPWKSNKYYVFSVYVCSLSYAPYYNVIYCLSGCTIFFHIISYKGRFSEKVIEHKMCVLIFSTNLSETFLILRRIQRDIIINVQWSSSKVPVILVTWIFPKDFQKILKYEISWKSYSENRVVPCGPRDEQQTRLT